MTVMFALYLSQKKPVGRGAIDDIKERGWLIATLEPNSLDYFLYKGTPRGFGLNLLESFARSLQVPFTVVACTTGTEAYDYLQRREADIIASPLPATRMGKNLVHFSLPLMEHSLVLVQRKSEHPHTNTTSQYITRLSDLHDDTIIVCQSPFFQPLYERIASKTGKNVIIKEIPQSHEILYQMVAEGKIRYTVCPAYLAGVLSRVYPTTDAGLEVTRAYPFAWAVNHPSDSLLMLIDTWLDSISRTGFLQKLYDDYFKGSRTPGLFQKPYFSLLSDKLSPWDDHIRFHSQLFWWDWRLIASLIYAESNFVPGLTSHKNAYGLMQMIPSTADIYGLDTTSSVSHQIIAGIQYLKWIDNQLPPEISDSLERASFILAAYNLGIGRVSSLRQKAITCGKDPNQWHGHVEYFLEKQSLTDPFAFTDTLKLFPVDYNLDGYVDGIIRRYFHYRNLIPD